MVKMHTHKITLYKLSRLYIAECAHTHTHTHTHIDEKTGNEFELEEEGWVHWSFEGGNGMG
jgi:hypothetical protein